MGFWRDGNKEEFGGEELVSAGPSLLSSPFTGLFLAGCSPALPASASPGGVKFVFLYRSHIWAGVICPRLPCLLLSL